MILIDANALIVLMVGLVNPALVGTHERTSIYKKEDFDALVNLIGDFNRLVVLPNVWTEVDNLLNGFRGDRKWKYITAIKEIIQNSSERYMKSLIGAEHYAFIDIGLTDALLVECSKDCDLLITADSKLADYARANNVKVLDMVGLANTRL